MRKKIFCLLLVIILPIILVFTGCAGKEIETINNEEELFVIIDDFYAGSSYYFFVLVNKKTRVMYLTQNNGGMTVMVNPDGTPMIWEGEL